MQHTLSRTLLALAIASTVGSYADDTQDEGYIGLEWTLGKSLTPAIVVGYRHASVDRDGDTDGGDISVSYNIGEGFDKITLKGFDGDEDVQGEVGIGYSLQNSKAFLTLGAQGQYVNAGVNIDTDFDLDWHAAINSIEEYDEEDPLPITTIICPPGTIPNPSGNGCLE